MLYSYLTSPRLIVRHLNEFKIAKFALTSAPLADNVYLIFEYLDADFLKLLRNHIIHCMPEGQIKGLGQQLLQGMTPFMASAVR